MRDQHEILAVDEATALTYGDLARHLRREGPMIASNDLWIAATSLRNDLPLVTANLGAFRRIPGLDVVGYR